MSVSDDDGFIYVNYGATNDVYDALQHADDAIGKVLEELEGVIQPLIGTWEGISADAWQSLQQGWNDQLNQLNRDLASNASTLQEMSINYGTTDNNLTLQWQDITLA